MTPLAPALIHLPSVNLDDRVEKLQGVFLGTLEGVAADDGSEAAAVADGANLIEHRFVIILLGAAGEDHDAVTIKGALDNVADALGEGSDGDTHLLVNFLGFRLLNVRAGQ